MKVLHADLFLRVHFSCRRPHLFSYITYPSILCLCVQYICKVVEIVLPRSLGGSKYTDSWLFNCQTGSHDFLIYLQLVVTWTDRFIVLLGFICSPQMIYAETRTCILSVIQCSTVQCLLFKCNVSSSSQSVCISLLISQECKQVEKDSPYYDFHYNTRRARPSIVHFQV